MFLCKDFFLIISVILNKPHLNKTINIQNLTVGYRKNKNTQILLSELKLDAVKGETIALVGINGSGKSSLLRCITGIQKPLSGNIFLNSKSIQDYSGKDRAKTISFVTTTNFNVSYMKVSDIVSFGRFPYLKFAGQTNKNDKKIINNSLQLVGMSAFADKNINEISDGERQKIMLASALAQDTEIILLDEPAAFLDTENKYMIYELLQKLASENQKTIIFSTHDLDIALNLADKIWLLKNNSIIQAAPEDLILNNHISKIFSSEKVYFDKESFNFKYQKTKQFPVNLTNKTTDNNIYKITEKALNRKSFYVSEQNEDVKISIEKTNNIISWEVTTNKNQQKLNTIYDITNYLTSIYKSESTI